MTASSRHVSHLALHTQQISPRLVFSYRSHMNLRRAFSEFTYFQESNRQISSTEHRKWISWFPKPPASSFTLCYVCRTIYFYALFPITKEVDIYQFTTWQAVVGDYPRSRYSRFCHVADNFHPRANFHDRDHMEEVIWRMPAHAAIDDDRTLSMSWNIRIRIDATKPW